MVKRQLVSLSFFIFLFLFFITKNVINLQKLVAFELAELEHDYTARVMSRALML